MMKVKRQDQKLKVGDMVLTTDGSCAVRIDKYESNTIGLDREPFEVIALTYDKLIGFQSIYEGGIKVHDIVIQNTVNKHIYLHSSSMISLIKKDKSELKKVLKKTIQQWELMRDTGKSKTECYTFLGGTAPNHTACFLCDSFYSSCSYSKTCISWINGKTQNDPCLNNGSPFRIWTDYKTQENLIKVIDHLKSEYEKLN